MVLDIDSAPFSLQPGSCAMKKVNGVVNPLGEVVF